MKIYTRTGDGGATTLFDGTRIAKSDPRVDAYGEVDEANAAVGVARASGVDADIEEMLRQIQRDLFALGSRLADRLIFCVLKSKVLLLEPSPSPTVIHPFVSGIFYLLIIINNVLSFEPKWVICA